MLIVQDNQSEIFDIIDRVKSKSKIQPVTMGLKEFKNHMKNNTLFYKSIKSDAIIFYINPAIKEDIAKYLEDIQYQKQNG